MFLKCWWWIVKKRAKQWRKYRHRWSMMCVNATLLLVLLVNLLCVLDFHVCCQIGLTPLHWRHNGCDSVSNHQPHHHLLNRLFRRRTKETSKLRVTGLCVGNSPETGEFPAQMASNAENVSIWWRYHAISQGGGGGGGQALHAGNNRR